MDLAAARSDRRGARRCWPRVRPVSGAVRGIRLAAQLLAGLRRDRDRLDRLAAPPVGRCGPARSSRGGPTRPHPGRRRRRWSRGPPGRSRAARLASAHRSLRGRGRRRCAALPRDPGGPRPRRSIARRWTSRVGCATAWRRDPRSRSTARTTLRTTSPSSPRTSRAWTRWMWAPSSTATSGSRSAWASTARRWSTGTSARSTRGAVRFSPGVFTTAEDIDRAIAAMRAIPHHRRGQQRPPTVGPPRRVVSQGGSGPAGHADVTLYRLGQAALLLAPRQAVARLGRSGPRPGGRASDAGRDR